MTPEQYEAWVAKVLGVPKAKAERKTGRRLSHTLAFGNGMTLAYTVTAWGNGESWWRVALLMAMTIGLSVAEVYSVAREDRE